MTDVAPETDVEALVAELKEHERFMWQPGVSTEERRASAHDFDRALARLHSLLLRAEEERVRLDAEVQTLAAWEPENELRERIEAAEKERDEWEAAWQTLAQENRRLRALEETKEAGETP